MASKSIIIDQAATPLSHSTGELRRTKKKPPPDEQREEKSIKDKSTGVEETDDKSSNEEGEGEQSDNSGESAGHEKEEGKDEQEQAGIETRAERIAEEPYLTESELMEGGNKDKTKNSKDKDKKKGKNKQKEEAQTAKKDLNKVVTRADKILFKAKGIFPFDFFPDTMTIDANKINIIQKSFFFTEALTSILLKEVMDVRVESALFMGQLIIDYGPHPLKISTVVVPKLRKKDALKAKEIIEGVLVVYRSENINTTDLNPEETMEEMKEIGKVEERE